MAEPACGSRVTILHPQVGHAIRRLGQNNKDDQFLKEHPEVAARIDAKVREKTGLKPKAPRPAEAAPEEKGARRK